VLLTALVTPLYSAAICPGEPRDGTQKGGCASGLRQFVEASQRVGAQTALSCAGSLQDAFSQAGTNTLRVALRRELWPGDVRVNNYLDALKQKLPRSATVRPACV
jgi:hypothetical protein